MYVDDILLTSTSLKLIRDLISKLHNKLDKPKHFLGIEMHNQPNEAMLLIHTKYIKYLLATANMTHTNGVSTLMFSHCKLSKHRIDSLAYLSHYCLKVRALPRVTLIRHVVAYYVNKAYPSWLN